MRIAPYFLLAALAVSSPAFAKTDKPKLDKNDPNRVICRRVETTGSIRGTKVCHTLAEWDALNHQESNTSLRFDAQDARTHVNNGG